MSLHLIKFQVVTMFLVLNKKRRVNMLNIFRDTLERDKKDTQPTKGEEKKCKIHDLKTKEHILTPLIASHSQ